MLKLAFYLFSLIVTFISSNVMLAHPGHGDPQHQEGILHYLTAPEHFIPILLVFAALGFLFYKFGIVNRKQQQLDKK